MNRLSENWNGINELIIYGFGTVSSRCIDKLMQDFTVPFIIDNNPNKGGTFYKEIPIISWEEAKDKLNNRKILVTTKYGQYYKIAQSLKNEGLEEYNHFCCVKEFISEWYWKNQKKCCLYTVDMTVTTNCTYNCEHCNMFIPYYKNPVEITFDELKNNVDLFFSVVDYVFYIGLIGGEPFLCKSLPQIITYIVDNYGDRVGSFAITTNGSVTPDDATLRILKENNVMVVVSDYGSESLCKNKTIETISKLTTYQINCNIKNELEWKSMGFPQKPRNYDTSTVFKHMKDCLADWRGLNDGKFYFCNIAWSAEKAGLIKLDQDDFVDLRELKLLGIDGKYLLLSKDNSAFSKGYMSFCKLCAGCGSDNTEIVTPGVQIKSK